MTLIRRHERRLQPEKQASQEPEPFMKTRELFLVGLYTVNLNDRCGGFLVRHYHG